MPDTLNNETFRLRGLRQRSCLHTKALERRVWQTDCELVNAVDRGVQFARAGKDETCHAWAIERSLKRIQFSYVAETIRESFPRLTGAASKIMVPCVKVGPRRQRLYSVP